MNRDAFVVFGPASKRYKSKLVAKLVTETPFEHICMAKNAQEVANSTLVLPPGKVVGPCTIAFICTANLQGRPILTEQEGHNWSCEFALRFQSLLLLKNQSAWVKPTCIFNSSNGRATFMLSWQQLPTETITLCAELLESIYSEMSQKPRKESNGKWWKFWR